MNTIIWDADDVLNNLMEMWLKNRISEHPDQTIGYSDLSAYPPHEQLGISLKEYYASLDAYRMQADKELEPRWTVLEWLHRNGANYRHFAITSRPLPSVPSLAEWVMRNFGEYIRGFAAVPSRVERNLIQYDRDKTSYLQWFGHRTILVDDNLNTVTSTRRLGIRAVLFPQPWNRSMDTQETALSKILTAFGPGR